MQRKPWLRSAFFRHRLVRLVLGGSLCCTGLLTAQSSQTAPSARYEPRVLVAAVRLVGNSAVKEQFIQGQLKTRKDREFDPDVVQADVRRLASTGRFQDVRTYTQQTPTGVVVTFEFVEAPTIRYIKYLGNRNISDKTLAKQDGLEVGDPLNRYAAEEARRKIEEYYHSKGFGKTRVSLLEGDQPHDGGVMFIIDEGQLERIAWVRFVGNTIASDERLKTQIQSKPGFLWYLFRGQVDRSKIDEDIERLTAYYRGLGFFNARIGRELAFDDSGQWLTLTFVIDEGPRYQVRSVAVSGNDKFPTERLLAETELKPGEYFNLAKMRRDVVTLRDVYGGEGHIFADVQADPRFLEEPGQLDLIYQIKEGGVWRADRINIVITGENPHTRESVVRNRLSIRPGDLLDTRELRASERRLMASQLFQSDPMTGSKPQVVVRPPELQESLGAERTASHGSTYRGQTPSER